MTAAMHICIYVHDVCVGYMLYIPADVPTRAQDANRRIVGARNRTHVGMAGGAATCTPIPISHTSTHIPIYTYI
jgi:hypothetical protein